jgi:hypothetical protein
MDWFGVLKNGVYLDRINSYYEIGKSQFSLKEILDDNENIFSYISTDLINQNDEIFSYILKELVDQNNEKQLFKFFMHACSALSYDLMIKVSDFVDCRLYNDEAFIVTCGSWSSDCDLRKTQFFINLGVDVNTRDGEALAKAIENNLSNISRLLLENGAIMTDSVKKMFIKNHNCPKIWDLLYEFGMEPHNIVTSNILLKNLLGVLRVMHKNNIDLNSIIYENEDH